MDVDHYIEEIDTYIDSLRLQIEEEKREITDSQKRFISLSKAFSAKAPSSSVLNSLFQDEEPSIFKFSQNEEKRKQLAQQRRAEYNAYLEKKEKELEAKRRMKTGKQTASPKSILEYVDYEQILAKRKEEEAQFRHMNIADAAYSPQLVINKDIKKADFSSTKIIENNPSSLQSNSVNISSAAFPVSSNHVNDLAYKVLLEEQRKKLAILEAEKNDLLLEERISKQLAEQRLQMLTEFENELRRNNQIHEEIAKLQSTNSVNSSPKRDRVRTIYLRPKTPETKELPKLRRTGGGGEPVRDPFGNLITLRGAWKENYDYKNAMLIPSIGRQPIRDKMEHYREELKKQIEEKKRLEALEKAKEREFEEKMEQRAEETRLALQKEYEKDHAKANRAAREFERQQERIRKLQEFQKKDAEERHKKLTARRREVENIPPNPIVPERSQSPPIPAVRTKVLLEKAVSVTDLPEIKPENTYSSLAEIRRKIKEEQQKPKIEKSYEVMNRRTVQEVSDDEDDFLQSSFEYPE